nr:glutathione S-transferase theta-1-like [Onthophagus taurus]
MSSTFKLYFDFMSPPSRGLLIILKMSKIPFEGVLIQLHKGQHLTEEYKNNISRFGKVPVLEEIETNFTLTESVAILRYLQREKGLLDDLYPANSQKQARVDEFLEWEHNNLRASCAMYFYFKSVMPRITASAPDPIFINFYKNQMEESFDALEKLWIQDKPFITGNKLSAADIFAISDYYQARLTIYDGCKNRPKLTKWMKMVQKELGPYLDEVNQTVNKIIQKNPVTN